MVRSHSVGSLIAYLFLLAFTSCEADKELVVATPSSDSKIELVNFPERIPSESSLFTLATRKETDWAVYDEFYKREVLQQVDKPYYNNLQWASISHLVNYTDFLESSDKKAHLFYLREAIDRSYINEPDVAVLLLLSLKENDHPEAELAAFARKILEKNEAHLSTENYKNHKERYSESLSTLTSLGYDRWGNKR